MRDHIYECLFLGTSFVVKNLRTREVPSCHRETFSSLQLHPDSRLAMLNVSRSTHKEAKRVLYRHGSFLFNNFSIGGPLLHEVIDSMPAITLLQNITLHIDVGAMWYDELVFEGMATRLIHSFADLDPGIGVPRNCFSVEIQLFHGGAFPSFDPYSAATGLTDALGRLMGFQTVEVMVWYSGLQWRIRAAEVEMDPLHDALDETLTKKFGKVKNGSDKQRLCWIYHPHKG